MWKCRIQWVSAAWILVPVLAVLWLSQSIRGESGSAVSAPEKFTLVYNVNNSGYIDVCGCKYKEVRQGSLTRRVSFLKQLRSTGRNILLLDGGSSLFPIEDRVKEEEHAEAVRKAELIVEAYNRMGYKAMAVGAFDLAAGIDTLKKLEKKAKFKMLSANLLDGKTGERYFPAHTTIRVGGLRIGVFGLTLETLTRPFLEKVAPDAQLADPVEAARSAFAELRGKTDLVIALSHVREETNFELTKVLKGLEILIDPYIQYGNHRTWVKEEEWVGFKEDTLFLRSDGQGARLGVVDVEIVKPRLPLYSGSRLDELQGLVNRGEAGEPEKEELSLLLVNNRFRFQRVSLEPHHGQDAEMDYLTEKWKEGADPAKVETAEAASMKSGIVTHGGCEECHTKQYQFWMTTTHFNAYETLKKSGDEKRYDCLGCHTIGYGEAFLDPDDIGDYGAVQCESCHGTKPKHVQSPEDHRFGKVQRSTCITCHNKEVTKNAFYFSSARRQVACPKG